MTSQHKKGPSTVKPGPSHQGGKRSHVGCSEQTAGSDLGLGSSLNEWGTSGRLLESLPLHALHPSRHVLRKNRSPFFYLVFVTQGGQESGLLQTKLPGTPFPGIPLGFGGTQIVMPS